MKKIPLSLKVIPLALPFLLMGCEELNSFFGDSSQSPGYNTSYSSYFSPDPQETYHSQETYQTPAVERVKTERTTQSSPKNSSSQSGTVATTVSAPVNTEKKTTTGTVDTPAVPSVAPTVGQ